MAQDVDLRRGEAELLITGAKLRKAVEEGTFIEGGDVKSVETVKYDFHMGSRVLKAFYGQPKDIETIPEQNRWVDPGEAVFILTREKLNLPDNMIAVLTPKRKLAHSGIMILGGLAVDPNYKGVLLVGLYNFSSTPYPIRAGSKLVGAVFYELDKKELVGIVPEDPEEILDFPDELIRLIQNYKPVEMKGLQEALSETQRQLDALKSDITSDKQWREDFKSSLQKHDQQLSTLIQVLEKEQAVRSADDEKIKAKLESMSNMFFGARMAWMAFTAILIAAVSAIAGWGVPKLMEKPHSPPTVQAPATLPSK
jgi:dCTP deaminase